MTTPYHFEDDHDNDPDAGDNARDDRSLDTVSNSGPEGPEPPVRWRPDTQAPHAPTPQEPQQDTRVGIIGATRIELSGSDIAVFESARRLITVSQVCAIVSFFIGGVLLSTVALVCAVLAYRKLDLIAASKESHPEMQYALKKVGFLAIGLAALALIINIIALIVLYPLAMDALQNGSVDSLFGGSASTSGGTGSSTWG